MQAERFREEPHTGLLWMSWLLLSGLDILVGWILYRLNGGGWPAPGMGLFVLAAGLTRWLLFGRLDGGQVSWSLLRDLLVVGSVAIGLVMLCRWIPALHLPAAELLRFASPVTAGVAFGLVSGLPLAARLLPRPAR